MNNTLQNQHITPAIREFIATRLLYSESGFGYSDETPLFREGILDSLAVVELVEFVQEHFGIKVEQPELRPDNFDSVARLTAFVCSKLGK